MKVITIKQPWPWLIAHGWKDVENRTWETSYRGNILIHVSRSSSDLKDETIAIAEHIVRGAFEQDLKLQKEELRAQMGCVIARANLVDIRLDTSRISPWAMKGYFHWFLDAPVLLDRPFPAQGKRWLWDLSIW